MAWDKEQRLWVFVNGRDYLQPKGTPESFYRDHPGDAKHTLTLAQKSGIPLIRVAAEYLLVENACLER